MGNSRFGGDAREASLPPPSRLLHAGVLNYFAQGGAPGPSRSPPGPPQAAQGVPGHSSVAVHGPVLWPRVTRRRQPARGGKLGRSWGPWVRGPGRGARDGGRPQTHRCVVDVGVRPLGGGGQVLGVAQPLFGGHAATGSHSSEGGPQGRAALLRVYETRRP